MSLQKHLECEELVWNDIQEYQYRKNKLSSHKESLGFDNIKNGLQRTTKLTVISLGCEESKDEGFVRLKEEMLTLENSDSETLHNGQLTVLNLLMKKLSC